MQQKRYEYSTQLRPGDTISDALLSPTVETPYDSPAEPMEGVADNAWLDKGFAIHEYPCRRHFRSNHSIRGIALEDVEREFGVESGIRSHFGLESGRLDRSGFRHTPTYLKTVGRLFLDQAAPAGSDAATARIRMTTCGGTRLWLNGKLAGELEPYTRNTSASVSVDLVLEHADNDILFVFDDLAERDTIYYLTLEYLSGPSLIERFPVPVSEVDVADTRSVLNMARLERSAFTEGEVDLVLDRPVQQDTALRCTARTGFVEREGGGDRELTIRAGTGRAVLGRVGEVGLGYVHWLVSHPHPEVELARVFHADVYPAVGTSVSETGLRERKRLALEFIADNAGAVAHRSLARLAEQSAGLGGSAGGFVGAPAPEDATLLKRQLDEFAARYDCSDFYLIPILWMWFRYREQLPGNLQQRIRQTVLGFRYWIDEPGSDVMWYFSENHALLFHVAEYLAGSAFPEEQFTNSGESGTQHLEKARTRLSEWFTRFDEQGFAEWNSTSYIPIDISGLLALFELAPDENMRTWAEQSLDFAFSVIQRHSLSGVLAASHGRTYEQELFGRYTNSTSSLSWIAWGTGYLNHRSIAQVPFAMSSYEPPRHHAEVSESAPGYLVRLSQGKKGFVNVTTLVMPDYLVSTAEDFKPGRAGYQEHIVQGTLGPEAQVWINHPGELATWGLGRPSYWAGNGVLPRARQYGNTVLLLYRLASAAERGGLDAVPADFRIEFTHAYFPGYAFDEVRTITAGPNGGVWHVGRHDTAYAAVWAPEAEYMNRGPYAGRELVQRRRDSAWILKLSNAAEFGEFSAFCASLSNCDASFTADDRTLRVNDPQHGDIALPWEGDFTVEDVDISVVCTDARGRVTRIHTWKDLQGETLEDGAYSTL